MVAGALRSSRGSRLAVPSGPSCPTRRSGRQSATLCGHQEAVYIMLTSLSSVPKSKDPRNSGARPLPLTRESWHHLPPTCHPQGMSSTGLASSSISGLCQCSEPRSEAHSLRQEGLPNCYRQVPGCAWSLSSRPFTAYGHLSWSRTPAAPID